MKFLEDSLHMIIGVIFAPAAAIAFIPVFLMILAAVGVVSTVEFSTNYVHVFQSFMNIVGILICPIASLKLFVASRKRKLPATLLSTLCFLLLQGVFLFMVNYGGMIDGITSNTWFDSLFGFTIGWAPLLLYAIILGLGVRSGRCEGFGSDELFRSVGLTFVFAITISEWAGTLIGHGYTNLMDLVFWGVAFFVFILLINFIMYAIVWGFYRLFSNARNR